VLKFKRKFRRLKVKKGQQHENVVREGRKRIYSVFFVRKPKRKKPFGSLRRRRVDSVTVQIKDVDTHRDTDRRRASDETIVNLRFLKNVRSVELHLKGPGWSFG